MPYQNTPFRDTMKRHATLRLASSKYYHFVEHLEYVMFPAFSSNATAIRNFSAPSGLCASSNGHRLKRTILVAEHVAQECEASKRWLTFRRMKLRFRHEGIQALFIGTLLEDLRALTFHEA
jgi:hypothetical protein